MTLGSLLRRHRTAAGLTQEELAEKAEVSARTVSDVERGLRTRIYRDTASRLASALGLDSEARAEFERVARGRKPRSGSKSSSIPIPPTPLIGREREIAVVLAALEQPDIRLLTLTGPGGIGKTRIAVEAAARTEGAIYVELANASDPSLVVAHIAKAVGVPGVRLPTVRAIAERLGKEATILVLDTFEHLLDATPSIAELISACWGLTVLITSREALRIRGEHEILLSVLEHPSSTEVHAIENAPSTALFIQRARAVRPDLLLDAPSAEIIFDICRRLEGLPLAIELAAARTKHLSLKELRDLLKDQLVVLTRGPRDLPGRQRTMRDAVEWSYNLMEKSEQELFADLSVFAGGWTIDAAEAVCGGREVLARLSALVDKSLVTLTSSGETRYRMLDVIREFAEGLPQSTEAEERHSAYFLSLAESAEQEFGGTGQRTWMRRMATERGNIAEAIRSSLRRTAAETALRIAGGIWRFWLLNGDLAEGRRLLRDSIDAGEAAPKDVQAKAIWGLAWLAFHQGDYEALEACAHEVTDLISGLNDPVQRRNALTIKGIADLAHLRIDEAIRAFEQCVELLRPGGSTWLLATSLLNLGQATLYARDGRSGSILEQSRQMYLDLGDAHFASRAAMYLGYSALLDEDVGRARALFAESLRAFWEMEDLWGITECLEAIATLIARLGDDERAARLAASSQVLREQTNTSPFPADRAFFEDHAAQVRKALGDEAWAAVLRAGRTMTLEEAVELALG